MIVDGKDLASIPHRNVEIPMMNRMPEKTMFEQFRPLPAEIDRLIEEARNHPLGIEFLLQGDLCAVAIMFKVAVFTVEAARENLTM